MLKIDIDTKFIYLLGNPLRQSYAQDIQNYLFDINNLNYYYIRVEIERSNLAKIIDSYRYLSCGGLCVTKPNKVEVLKHLDEFDESVEVMGACNTIQVKDGKYKGYNTDGFGFIKAIENKVAVKNGRFFSFGAGGAGRACCIQLAEKGASHIAISDPCEDVAKSVVGEINARHPGVAVFVNKDNKEFYKDELKHSELIANMSGLGMYSSVEKSPMNIEDMDNDAFYFDATYNPGITKFMRDAESTGHNTMNGLTMMLELSVEQFRIWTGVTTTIDTVNEYAERLIVK